MVKMKEFGLKMYEHTTCCVSYSEVLFLQATKNLVNRTTKNFNKNTDDILKQPKKSQNTLKTIEFGKNKGKP